MVNEQWYESKKRGDDYAKKIKHIEKPVARQFNVLYTDMLFANPNTCILAYLTHDSNWRIVQSVQFEDASFDEASERSQSDFV